MWFSTEWACSYFLQGCEGWGKGGCVEKIDVIVFYVGNKSLPVKTQTTKNNIFSANGNIKKFMILNWSWSAEGTHWQGS